MQTQITLSHIKTVETRVDGACLDEEARRERLPFINTRVFYESGKRQPFSGYLWIDRGCRLLFGSGLYSLS